VQAVGVATAQQRLQVGMARDRHPERLSHGRQRHVVVRRADTAGGEHAVEARRQGAHALGDLVGHVGHHLDPAQRHAQGPQLADQEMGVLVLDLAGEELVPDEEDGGCRVCGAHCAACGGDKRGQIIVLARSGACEPFRGFRM
jgi:hypothetical protein